MPDLNNTRNIGSPTNKWRKMYATTFIGSLEGSVSGSVSGKSGSADKLTTSTTFRLTGDVETVENVFDGQTGGAVKDFNISIKNTIISGKQQVTDSLSNDEFIIDRISGSSTGLRRISRGTLFQNIAGLTPIGSIMPFAGNIEPTSTGWFFCNGQELSQGVYNTLYQLIGFTYKAQGLVTAGNFALPDLRGRFPLGALTMGGTNPSVETPDTRSRDSNSSVLGAVDGTDEATIDVNNLPEHEHDLRAENGVQFTAIRAVDGRGGDKPDDASLSTIQTGTDQLSQTIDKSGGILTPTVGDDLNIMNPYQTVNYIIYTGVTS